MRNNVNRGVKTFFFFTAFLIVAQIALYGTAIYLVATNLPEIYQAVLSGITDISKAIADGQK